MSSSDYVAIARINDGYPFKIFIGMLKTVKISTLTVGFSPEGLRILSMDDAKEGEHPTQIFENIIDHSEMHYKYNDKSDDTSGDKSDDKVWWKEYEIKDVNSLISQIKKKSPLLLFAKKDNNRLYIVVDPRGDELSENTYVEACSKGGSTYFANIDYDIPIDKPIIKVDADVFTQECKKFTSINVNKRIAITCYTNRITLQRAEATVGTGSTATLINRQFGKSDNKDSDDVIKTLEHSPHLLKALSKVDTLGGRCLIAIYYSDSEALRIRTKCGSFGTVNIYLP